jgi:protein-tyrosine phosphatase
MKIIDIHTHMLYGIDDGANDGDMSLTLMGIDCEQGVRGIFCTNHSYGMEDNYKDYHGRFEKLRDMAEEKYPGLSLYKGCEVLCRQKKMPETIANIKNDIYPTLNGTDYVLMEFDPHGKNGMGEMQ